MLYEAKTQLLIMSDDLDKEDEEIISLFYGSQGE